MNAPSADESYLDDDAATSGSANEGAAVPGPGAVIALAAAMGALVLARRK